MNALRFSFVPLAAVACAFLAGGSAGAQTYDFDVVVYGGTSGGVTAAVQAARLGKSVALIDPGVYTLDLETAGAPGRYVSHLGGMSSSGLGATDIGDGSTVGGTSYEFYRRLQQKGQTSGSWRFTPGNAEVVFDEMVDQAGVDVFRLEQLDRNSGVSMTGSTINAITTKSGKTFNAKTFIDAGYEGDLMAAAGARYVVGREARSQYGETFNGIAYDKTREHDFDDNNADVDPYVVPGNPGSGLLPGIHYSSTVGNNGDADHRLQAYNYRLTMSTNSGIKVPWSTFFAKPGVQDVIDQPGIATRFELHNRFADETGNKLGEMIRLNTGVGGGKNDINNWGPTSTDYIGGNYDVYVPATGNTVNYAEASDVEREYIIKEHIRYTLEFLHFLANDPQLGSQMNQWGLADDEFTDNANFPHQIYVREARRMVGEYIMTELNTRDFGSPVDVPAGEEIGIGSYAMDSHNTHRYIRADGMAEAEGNFWLGGDTRAYSIAYGSITPQEAEVDNLLVSSAFSATHIAYGSMRMEPVFMISGQAAGLAAALAIDGETSVQGVDRAALQQLLRQYGAILTTTEPGDGSFVGTMTEEFNYGGADGRLERMSYIAPGWEDIWSADSSDPQYRPAAELGYAATGYRNGLSIGDSGGASDAGGAKNGYIATRDIRGGIGGEVWFSALVQLDALGGGEEALVWFDKNLGDGTGDAYVGLNADGHLVLMHSNGTIVGEAGSPVHVAGQAHLIMAKLSMNASGTADAVEIWIDPDLTELGAADITLNGVDVFGDDLNNLGISVGASGGKLDSVRLSNLATGRAEVVMPGWVAGDFDATDDTTVDDVDMLMAAIGRSSTDVLYDINPDGTIDLGDLNVLIGDILGTAAGDLDLSGDITFAEAATAVANIGLTGAGWADGDFNADGVVGVDDATMAVNGLPDPAMAQTLMAQIPEPGTLSLMALGALAGMRRNRR